MATSEKHPYETPRAQYIERVSKILATGPNEIALPCVDNEGNDEFIVIKFKTPTGSHGAKAEE